MLSPELIGFFCIFLCCQRTYSQGNSGLDQDPTRLTFSLTSSSDCSDEPKNIYGMEATVVGFKSNSLTGPTDCTIRLTSEDGFQNVQLSVTIISSNIGDCRTTLGIYDGHDGNILDSFDCRSHDLRNRRMMPTSGDTVTFRFTRPNEKMYDFDIQIRVVRLRGGPDPEDTWSWGDSLFFDKFPQETIVGMIGGFYGLILLICISLVVYFNFKFQGRLKRWETHQLSTMKTDTAFDTRSQVTEPNRVWAMELNQSRGPSSYYSRSQAEPYSRRNRGASEDGSSVVYDHDDSFQRSLMANNRRDQNRYQDRMASENTNFNESEEDDPDHFVEKVITPRVKTQPRGRRDHRPPSFEEATNERSSRHSSDETEDEETASSYASSTKKRLTSSEEETSESSEYSTETETETESHEDSRRRARARRRREKLRKEKERSRHRRRRQSSTDGETSSYRSGPRDKQRPPAAPAAGGPYAGYPPGQFVPVMAGPPAFQPLQMVPNYAPPQYPEDPQAAAPRQPQVRPTDPPVYSYLVRRGYTPMDPNTGRNSPASSNSHHDRVPADEPEIPLQSGVDYMRR